MNQVDTPLAATLRRIRPELGALDREPDLGAVDRDRLRAMLPTDQPFETGRKAVERIVADGEAARLRPEERINAEVIVNLNGRPALKVARGRFEKPPETWAILEKHRRAIQHRMRSVGRIELADMPSITLVGTAFLVARDVLMTNRHVVEMIAKRSPDEWQFVSNTGPRIDFRAELPPARPREYPLTEIIGVHRYKHVDLALLRMKPNKHDLPEPLPIAADYDVKPGTDVYVVGHPAFDPEAPKEEQDMQRLVFEDCFDVKRVAPGKVLGRKREGMTYDSSTLGGNSGSCVVDVETDRVVALHFGGKYLLANYGVRLWELRDDPLLRKVDLNYV